MKKNDLPPITLESVQQAFAKWRQIRPCKKSPIPQQLLEQVNKVCQTEPLSKVARQLGLNYTVLKRQLESTGSNTQTGLQAGKQDFIEVNLASTGPSALLIEMQRISGETIRFTFSGIGDIQIQKIVQLFL
ncbi:MAG TPA: hypothetical protein VE912_16170 [Bacteroidales bacterium]|nr:hypothetical protein [Bacteroidales bacterium]